MNLNFSVQPAFLFCQNIFSPQPVDRSRHSWLHKLMRDTTSSAFFESMYKHNPDPWNFSSSEYEQRRYEAIIAALTATRYTRAFEPGCSIGVLSTKLAPLCGQLIAIDISPTAIQEAQQNCRSLTNVDLRIGRLPQDVPDGHFDLIVLSEIGYYFKEPDLLKLATMLVDRLTPKGILLAVHWTGHSDDHLISGDRVHEILLRLEGLMLTTTESHAGFRLNKWVRI